MHEFELNPSFGYWLRFNEPGSEIISGLAITQMDVTIHEGWNLISSITFPVEINNISDPEGLIIFGTIYGFNGSYISVAVLEPRERVLGSKQWRWNNFTELFF